MNLNSKFLKWFVLFLSVSICFFILYWSIPFVELLRENIDAAVNGAEILHMNDNFETNHLSVYLLLRYVLGISALVFVIRPINSVRLFFSSLLLAEFVSFIIKFVRVFPDYLRGMGFYRAAGLFWLEITYIFMIAIVLVLITSSLISNKKDFRLYHLIFPVVGLIYYILSRTYSVYF